MPAPKAWAAWTDETEVEALPLKDGPRTGKAGWCTSGANLEESPDVEVISGGINAKAPIHAAVWRQGNLLHFGFQESPAELNETGRDLLENAVHHVARFTEDRPIAVTPAGFVDKRYPRARFGLRRRLADPEATVERLARFLSPARKDEVLEMEVADARTWVRDHMGYLASDETGFLDVDEDARALGATLDGAAFFDAALAGAADPKTAPSALALLARRVPEGPGAEASVEDWRAFLEAHRPYLFFIETAGYVWRVDPLALRRGVPTAELRGSARADR